MAVKGVLEVWVEIRSGEVEVIARKGEVSGESLVAAVNKAFDSAHTFKAELKSGPEPVE